MSELALQRIHEAKENSLTSLSLKDCDLSKLPKELFKLNHLKELDLSNNNLSSIVGLAKLTCLKRLSLRDNKVRDLDEFLALSNLIRLDLSFNGVEDISSLGGLVKLRELFLSNNIITNIEPLTSLRSLLTISLKNNIIENIFPLKNLNCLSVLDLSSNNISDISVLEVCINLKHLYLSNNKIFDLTPLSKLFKLEYVDLNFNRVKSLEGIAGLNNITGLHLYSNNIESLAPIVNIIKNNIPMVLERSYIKRQLNVGKNPITEPPISVVQKGNEEVLDYFKILELGRTYINEAKLIIVGEPEAGKTSLMECLWDPNFTLDPNSQSTLGIEVREGWEFPHPNFKNLNFTTNIWDFGGQHIQYMTHQFFLTPDSVYVLVSANDRKENTNFPYWFKIINLLGQSNGNYSPVVVVLNEKNREFIHNFSFRLDDIRRQYPNIIVKVCEVNLANRDGKFAALEQIIQETLTSLPFVKSERPAAWQPIREALRDKAKTCDYINFKEYTTICELHGVTEERQQLLFSRYLHRLGTLLHFENDPSLVDFIILNPQWAVDAVYAVIADNSIEQNKGYFTRDQVEKIWLNKKDKNGRCLYSKDERARLFSLMQKENFEICYALHNRPNEFIAPQLLSVEPPEYEWDNDKNLKFRYQYTFMPQGIIARLIVRLSHLIKQQNGYDIVWRQGMVLEDKEKQCSSLIQEDEVEGLKVIDIAINGNPHQRKYMLYDIRSALKELHKRWFSNIQVEEMIPCNCRECITKPSEAFYFKFSTLKIAQEKGKHVKECDKSCIDVPIVSLLEGIYKTEEIRLMDKDKMGSISITVGNNSQVNLGDHSVQKSNSDNYTVTQKISPEVLKNISELIKVLRNMDLSDDDMDVVDAARKLVREAEKDPNPVAQGKLASIWNGLKELMDFSNNSIGVATAVVPVLPKVIDTIKLAVL